MHYADIMRLPVLSLIITFLLSAQLAAGQSNLLVEGDVENASAMQASFVDEEIMLDGVLDEATWQGARAITGFKQYEPVDGAPASHQTEVKVLYGHNYLYIGALMYDDRPEEIEQALGRRDDFNRADWFLVSLDSYFDRRTAYTFGVNAAGVQLMLFKQVLVVGRGGAETATHLVEWIPHGMQSGTPKPE